ncbi:hypothetical protein WA158_000983 [Blastocystis sp. Blastoise]
MSQFSGKVLLGDLNDFINPSLECTNPIFTEEKEVTSGSKISLSFDLDDPFSNDVKPDIIKTTVKKVATVSLNDCLACSGCVTSAETILIQQHNVDEFINILKNKDDRTIVICLSLQAAANLAEYYHLSLQKCQRLLFSIFKRFGVDYILDSSCGDEVSMIETIKEYEYRNKSSQPSRLPWEKDHPSIAINSSMTMYPPESIPLSSLSSLSPVTHASLIKDYIQKGYIHNTKDYIPSPLLPMITSACPAIICYGEKTYPELLPYLSTVKSPQQILCTFLRDYFSNINNVSDNKQTPINSSSLYITSIVSCYDKKLEANRGDFRGDDGDRELNCVLTSAEIVEVLEKLQVDIHNENEIQCTNNFEYVMTHDYFSQSTSLSLPPSLGIPNHLQESGNYLNALISHIYSHSPVPLQIKWKPGKNPDFTEIQLYNGDECVFRGCYVYGYRNLQNIIMKIKRNNCPYDFIELMACPKGCLNGGGQKKEGDLLIVENIQVKFHEQSYMSNNDTYLPLENPRTNIIYQTSANQHTDQPNPFHTRYHVVVTSEHNSLNW